MAVSTTRQSVASELDRTQADAEKLRKVARDSQQLATLGAAAAMWAHEFNNMMTPVIGYAKHALNTEDPAAMKKALNTTLTQANSVLAMAERIMSLAHHEQIELQPTPLRELIDDAVKCLCRDLAKDGITLTLEVDHDLRIRANRAQFLHVFFNLLLNARDALAERTGRITIQAAPTDDARIRITVSDDGCGISTEHLDRVFEPFFSTKDASHEHTSGGSGLGLTLCKDIVTEHYGSISVQSSPDHGTVFTIIVPAAR